MNSDRTAHGALDSISVKEAGSLDSSLLLIESEDFCLEIASRTEHERTTRTYRGRFRYKGTRYNFSLTDPAVRDVRSRPFSRYNPQFNREELRKILPEHGITYLFLGDELGVRSDDPQCYENGQVQYERLARSEAFLRGIARIQAGMEKGFSIALMCAEKEPLDCHRTILVSRHLHDLGLGVKHIHPDGKLETTKTL